MQRAGSPQARLIALLLGLAALGAAWAGWVSRGGRAHDAGRGGSSSTAAVPSMPAPAGLDAAEPTPTPEPEREELAAQPGPTVPLDEGPPRPRGGAAGVLEGYLSLERENPGALAARAEEVLHGSASRGEKAAFLRALVRSDPAAGVRWLEASAGLPVDESDEHGASLAEFAVESLTGLAPRTEEARRALRHLAEGFAFNGPGEKDGEPALAVRRLAASAYARTAPDAELDVISSALLIWSHDQLLFDGVVAELERRPQTPTVTALLARLAPARVPNR